MSEQPIRKIDEDFYALPKSTFTDKVIAELANLSPYMFFPTISNKDIKEIPIGITRVVNPEFETRINNFISKVPHV